MNKFLIENRFRIKSLSQDTEDELGEYSEQTVDPSAEQPQNVEDTPVS